ncbi:MAG: hypothetical protein KME11_19300 [Timaviella obliquedivisa GSE-PSE-MK23-08B]|nr:hypothetical protein [Timaviella obliquedivisa GSE-PSE-MK23-08B]
MYPCYERSQYLDITKSPPPQIRSSSLRRMISEQACLLALTCRARTTIRLLQIDRSEERRLWMTSGLERLALPSCGELPESGRF